ncbi:metal ABC transporter solute-binding protein, Zn/Mn family [Sabulicella rubraurantiaca]|uniref:metal ABC transporter solute-binding protein, Zn/Mn family n=1 Tax=Sabulicella rubraurantiaca TaxID=2811429 RepID=UPI001A969634|nr:zinc ABC transporter substrate-binding protein [Sabulicella rubraurantiaca]
MNTCSGVARRAIPALILGLPALARAQGWPPRPLVVATTAMVAELARGIGGEEFAVETLMGEGVDPHLYRPTRADLARLLRADLILCNGLRLEGRMGDVLERAAATRPVIAVAEIIPPARRRAHPEYPDAPDPHLWMDPLLWAECAAPVAAALARLRPGFDTAPGLAALRGRLEEFAAYARRAFEPLPAERRLLVTAHDAFGYFGQRFGMELASIQGLSTEAEASLARIESLVALLVERRVPAVFPETSVPDRAVRALIEGAGARGHRVALGGALFSDSLGRPGTYRGTYEGMLDHNITTIARALGGDAPERGLRGQL